MSNATVPDSYISGLTHPATWIHESGQVALVTGMAWWLVLTAVWLIFFAFTYWRIRDRPMLVSAVYRIIGYCALLAVVYLYTSANEFVYVRQDHVLVRTFVVLANGAIQVLLVYVGSLHAVLHPTHDRAVFWLGVWASAQTTLASFAEGWQQWPGWIVGMLWYLPIPFIWVLLHRRKETRFSWHIVAWVTMWLALRVSYALIQLLGHTFSNGYVLETDTELALMLVLHTATLVPLVYAGWTVRGPPIPPGQYHKSLPNGDRLDAYVHAESD